MIPWATTANPTRGNHLPAPLPTHIQETKLESLLEREISLWHPKTRWDWEAQGSSPAPNLLQAPSWGCREMGGWRSHFPYPCPGVLGKLLGALGSHSGSSGALPGGAGPLPQGRERLFVTNSQIKARTGGTNPSSIPWLPTAAGWEVRDVLLGSIPNYNPNLRVGIFQMLLVFTSQHFFVWPLNPCLILEGATLHLPCPAWLCSEYPKKITDSNPPPMSAIFFCCFQFSASTSTFHEDSDI